MRVNAKTLLIGLVVFVLANAVYNLWPSSGPARTLPKEFELSQRVIWKWTTTLDAKADGKNLGKVSKEFLALTTTYDLEDNSGALTATASEALVSWGTEINVKDGVGKPIGKIKEVVFESLFKTWTTYRILDRSGMELATSEKTEFLSTDIILKAPSGEVLATMSRGWFTFFGDHWTVKVNDARIDPRLALMIVAFKTGADDKAPSDSGGSSTPAPASTKK
jgi:uncharacterized protein YxjI